MDWKYGLDPGSEIQIRNPGPEIRDPGSGKIVSGFRIHGYPHAQRRLSPFPQILYMYM
jgi:hypothetical protein